MEGFKGLARRQGVFYLVSLSLVLGIKYMFRSPGSEELLWILAPTAWWVRILCNIPFSYRPGIGYVSHPAQFIIGPTCSGLQFMVVSVAALTLSFLHRMGSRKKSSLWIGFCLLLAYLFTIFVNGMRILISIYLPLLFAKAGLFTGWLTRERFHTIIGCLVYFTALFLLCQLADPIAWRFAMGNDPSKPSGSPEPDSGLLPLSLRQIVFCWMRPAFWYILIVVGLPFLNKAYERFPETFGQHCLFVAAACLAVLAVLVLFYWFRRYPGRSLHRRFSRRKKE